MKTNFTRFRYVLAAVLCCLVSVSVWGETYSYTFTKSVFSKKVETQSLGDKNWALNTDGGFWGFDATKGQQIGSGSSPAKSLKLSTMDIPGTITSINVTTSGASSIAATLMVKVGDNNFGTQAKLSATSTKYTFEGNASGTIELNYTQTSAKALYIKSIEITYIEQTNKVLTPTFSPGSGVEFAGSLNISLACATEGAKIYYTTDGNTPTTSSNLYEASFPITATTTVKAIAVKDGLDNSEIAEATYTKVLPTPNFTYSTENVTVNLGETFTAPTLTYNNNSDLSGLNISYVSSNSNVATVDIATGAIQILSAGTTTIKATVEATGSYKGTDAIFVLNIFDPNAPLIINGSFEEGSNNWTLTDGDIATDKTLAHSGNNYWAYKLPAKGTTNKIEQTINSLIVGQKYKFSFWYNNYTSSNANGLKNYSKNGSYIDPAYDTKLPKVSEWTKYEFTFIATNTNFEVSIRVYETAIVDDISLELYKEQPSSSTDANGTMTLTGPWASSDLSALDLTDPTITGIDMTGITIPADAPALTPANPNCLIHVVNNTPESWKNVVSEDIALDINLQDGNNFYNSKAFEVADITYTRTFAKGWNTFSLPFDATITEGDVVEEFDTKTETSIKFKTATSIKANQAYLINIAEDNTEKVFTGTGVVPVTASTGDTFKSNFTKLIGTDAQGKYILVIQGGKEVFAPASEKATVAAFRGYLDLASGPAPAPKYTIEHDGGATNIDDANEESGMKIYSENGALVIYTSEIQNVQIYGLDGRMVINIQLSQRNNTINGLAKGIYLINNQKAIVK